MTKFLISVAFGFITLTLTGSNPAPAGRSAEDIPWRPPSARTGALVLVGGGDLPDTVRQRFLELAGGKAARIVIIPSASALPDAPARSYAFWKTAPVQSVRILHTTQRHEAEDPRFYGQLRDATGVWFSGGDQDRLSALFAGTGVERELRNLLRRGGVVGGTSAGASIVSNVMMNGGEGAGHGFGLIADAIVDQHFSNRGRLPRLLALLRHHPDQLGIGIDESTAVIIRGEEIAVLGAATVTVARTDGSHPTVQVYRSGNRFQKPAPVAVASRLASPSLRHQG